MSVTFKTPREVSENASFIVMQTWFGDLNFTTPPQKHFIRFSKNLINEKVTLTVTLPLTIAENECQDFEIPVDLFSKMKFIDRNASESAESEQGKIRVHREHPIALMFCLNEIGEEFIQEKANFMWEQLENHNNKDKKNQKLKSKNLLFCLDPSQIEMKEHGMLLYDVDYTEGIDQFQAVYCTVWAEHMLEHMNVEIDPSEAIVKMSGTEFMDYYNNCGLRVVAATENPLFGKRKTIRVFRTGRKVQNDKQDKKRKSLGKEKKELEDNAKGKKNQKKETNSVKKERNPPKSAKKKEKPEERNDEVEETKETKKRKVEDKTGIKKQERKKKKKEETPDSEKSDDRSETHEDEDRSSNETANDGEDEDNNGERDTDSD